MIRLSTGVIGAATLAGATEAQAQSGRLAVSYRCQ